MRKIDDFVDDMSEILKSYGVETKVADEVLEMEIKSAIGAINRCRRFTPHDDMLYDEKYEDKILPLAVTGYLKTGAEGEIMHTENGTTRQYSGGGKYPKDMLADIVPLAKFN